MNPENPLIPKPGERIPTEIEYPADKSKQADAAMVRFAEVEKQLNLILEQITDLQKKGESEKADKLIVETETLAERLKEIRREIGILVAENKRPK